MKKLIYLFTVTALMFCTVSCDDDDWTTNPEAEHIYYVGFHKSYVFSEKINFEIAADGTARWQWFVSASNQSPWEITGTDGVSSDIPFELHSQFKYTYNIDTYFFVTNEGTSSLVAGTDYEVVDASGNKLTLSDGKYKLTWSQANKENRKNVRIKRLTNTTGVLSVNTLNPAKGTPSTTDEDYIESTRNSLTDQYEVRGLTHDFKTVTVTFK